MNILVILFISINFFVCSSSRFGAKKKMVQSSILNTDF